MVSRKFAVAVSLLVLASMVLAACGPATTTVPGGSTQVPVTVVVTSPAGDPIVVTATSAPPTAIPPIADPSDPTSFVYVTFGEAESLDPALNYESAGDALIVNLYDMLVYYNREDASTFVAMLATEVPTVENGGISADGLTYTWKIRKGVKFHDGSELTPEDVAFSFQRGMLQGGTSSPQWLYYEAFFGSENVPNLDVTDLVNTDGSLADAPDALIAADAAALEAACVKVTDAVSVDGDTVVFKLAQPWGPMIATVSNSWGAIQNKAHVAANGGWDGDCKTWQNFYGKTSDQLNEGALGRGENGTGPYKLDTWTPGEEMILVANEDYWVTEPLWENGPTGAPALKKVIIKSVDEWSTRLAMAQAGDADFFSLGSAANYPQVDPLVGEECDIEGNCTVTDPTKPLRVFKGLQASSRTDMFLNFNINVDGGNNFVGSGLLDGNGVPPEFFSDIHIRKAFAYCFDWETYIADAQNGEGVQSVNVMLPGEIGYDADGDKYSFDPEKCAAEFEQSEWKSEDGKTVMEVGFRMTVAYNTGNTSRQTVAQILQANLSAVNPLFVIEVTGLPWPTFLQNQRAKKLPIFISGWGEDIHDPHNWVVPYALGTYASRQSLPADLHDQFAEIINRAVVEADPAKRAAIYAEFNQVYYDQVPTILLSVATSRHYEQRWVNGYFFNPIAREYYYSYSKK